jgi:hypothetical protein
MLTEFMTSAGHHSPLRRVLLITSGVVAAVAVAVGFGVIPLPGIFGTPRASRPSPQASLAAERTALDKQWASGMCTDILDWKNELQHDGTSLNFGFGPVARIHDAINASTHMLSQLNKLGLPPAQTAQARAETAQLRSDIESRLHDIEGAASSVASGNLAAIGTLVNDLSNDKVVGTQITDELRRVVSVDLGLSLVETRACRQLVGIPI